MQGFKQVAGSIKQHVQKLTKVHENGGTKGSSVEKMDAMTEILRAAHIFGLTNVFTYAINDLGSPITGLPGIESERLSLHAIGHVEGTGKHTADQLREQVRIAESRQLGSIVEKLKVTPEGKGSMFDNTTIRLSPKAAKRTMPAVWNLRSSSSQEATARST